MTAEREYVEFRGERWFVADARFDADGQGGGHWHLTLTAPKPVPLISPPRLRRRRPTADFGDWLSAEDVPGAVMPPEPTPEPKGWNGR